MSLLKKYQTDPKNLLNTALSMFKSRKIKTAIVEGVCDKRFLSQWIDNGLNIRFDGLDGKWLVEKTFESSKLKPYCDYDFLYFCADVDFDVVAKKQLHSNQKFVYNSFCFDEGKLFYNDLEAYLINTRAFEKVLVNLDVDTSEADKIRSRLERASRFVGSLRAADIIVQRDNHLSKSVLNGFEVRGFFDPNSISVDEAEVYEALPRWSNHPLYVEDLIAEAKRLDREYPAPWSLSRGHDVTEMLAMYFERSKHKGMTSDRIELMLRLACEFSEFIQSPMGRKFSAMGMI
ncbi:hypothetical protein [Rheinheimera texasensis]|uniref:hypothetical protein n=1 Tax=Rheinheimera texasensis TaxID=306205 RepID=UPI0032B271AC